MFEWFFSRQKLDQCIIHSKLFSFQESSQALFGTKVRLGMGFTPGNIIFYKKIVFLLKGWKRIPWQNQTLSWTKQTFFLILHQEAFIHSGSSINFFPHFCAKFKIAKIYVDCRIIHHSPVQATVSFAIHFFKESFTRKMT